MDARRSRQGASDWHGGGGPLKVSFHPGREPLCEAFLDAAAEAGTPRANNLNRVDRDAVGYLQRTIHRGRRFDLSARRELRRVTNEDTASVCNSA